MSKAKTILFRADSSSTIGTGHIMRDLVLAQKYLKKGVKIIFATQELEGNINYKIDEAGFKRVVLQSNSKKELIKVLKKLSVDLLIIDHYGIDYKKEKYIKEKTDVKILSFDDTYEKHHCDILLNHNISADVKKYKMLVPKECEICCGKRYTLLREEFYKAKKRKYKKSKIQTVFIAMGGADTAELNIQILKTLEKFPMLKFVVVTTSANKNLNKLQKFIKKKSNVELHINSNKIAKLMAKSDFAIITPSVTVNEVIFMELPFIAIQTAENQKDVVKYLLQHQYSIIEKFSTKKLEFFIDLEMQQIRLINFISLSKKEKEMVFEMRNDHRVRKWMYNQDLIKYEEHLLYIESLRERDDRVYFLVKEKKKYIGVVDLTNISYEKRSAELGIYANPALKGVGTKLMHIILQYAFLVLDLKKIEANVLKENKKAIALYKRCGFNIKDTKEYKDKELVMMELLYANR
jgi:UDP-2,4-diacetamido-2,4,6-trideoxy-beta-L-altropyranose hydrolase/UDP-4-amino-4,6-dideoxy-N-acetyl-beta-L-altrosamine N-acetyltransferase